ncbi:LysR family transcriptional regulator [Paenibacillus nasutitermitis]|uniref:LysR family transcriptional regulator n=1 Tax=Paenibacillus nasutitermitis TaxID=1652958 RepID=A0A916YKL9_9BACL|nr:LysR family transcriptional regulator [Paenibacillus nasutitermitis]GGD49902.1 LysR family transcriptional regulator [Paenibacillus nasutitermitis]
MVQNLEWYRVFYFTAKTGSLSKAAAELFITQPAVTQTIKQLEAQLGGQLFFRTSKGVTLTAEGEELYQFIEQAYNFIRNGERKIAAMHQLTEGEIRIGAGDTLCKHVLLPHLADFHKAYPAIKIHVTNRTTAETLQLLKQGHLDLGIVNMPVADKSVVIREMMQIEDCLIAGDAYSHLYKQRLAWDELMNYPIMVLEKGSATRSYLNRFAEQQGMALKPEIELGSVDLLVEFARRGFGLAFVVKTFIEDELAQGQIHQIHLKKPIPKRGIGLATLKDVPLTAAAVTFMQRMLASTPS